MLTEHWYIHAGFKWTGAAIWNLISEMNFHQRNEFWQKKLGQITWVKETGALKGEKMQKIQKVRVSRKLKRAVEREEAKIGWEIPKKRTEVN